MLKTSWKKYIDKTSANDPRPMLVEGLQYVETRGVALDLGAGALVDSKYLLSRGFERVIALDNDEASEDRAKEIVAKNFSFVKGTFEDFPYPKSAYDLISGQYAFSYIHKEKFFGVMQKIFDSLKKGGVITGHIYGNKDEWNKLNSNTLFLTKRQFSELFSDFVLLKFEEEEQDKKTALGKMRHFHTFHFIAKK